jgi:hypothetical protein
MTCCTGVKLELIDIRQREQGQGRFKVGLAPMDYHQHPIGL